MIDIRIVCTHEMNHDPQWSTATLVRYLSADQYNVEVSYGRHSLDDLDKAKTAREAVILIWSQDAAFSPYMLEWARTINPVRLVEIARFPRCPRVEGRVAKVIDFTTWRGKRGDRAWEMLMERLRTVQRDTEPAKPPPMLAQVAVGVAGMLAVVAAGAQRVSDDGPPMTAESVPITAPAIVAESIVTRVESNVPLGGALDVIEPSSVEELEPVDRINAPRTAPLQISSVELIPLQEYTPQRLPNPTLLDRISGLNPLRADNSGDSDDDA